MSFPIDAVQEELLATLNRHPLVLLQAPPGAGKTTQVPLWLLESFPNSKILLLEPRRLAAVNSAKFMAQQLGESVGDTIGYRIRQETRIGATTRLEVMTEGVFIRMLQADPELTGVDFVLLDEFHERHLNTDLALALSRSCQENYRPDLRLLLMSATLNGERLQKQLSAPLLQSEGRSFPVQTEFLTKTPNDWLIAAEEKVRASLELHPGNILVFAPGIKDIRLLHQRLADVSNVEMLHGSTDFHQQKQLLAPSPKRRVIISSPVAESSITLPDIRVVIDSGLARVPKFERNTGLTRLVTSQIPRDRADQRTGRAGRTDSGWCYRLWTQEMDDRLVAQSDPEISNSDYSQLLLEASLWGDEQLNWLTPPNASSLKQSKEFLEEIEALDSQGITSHGQQLLNFGCHPRLAHMMVVAQILGLAEYGIKLAAAIQENKLPSGEVYARAIEQLAANSKSPLTATIDQFRRQLESLKNSKKNGPTVSLENPVDDPDTAVALCAALAFPDRFAKAKTNGSFQMASGQQVNFFKGQQSQSQWIVALSLGGNEQHRVIQSFCACEEPDPGLFAPMFRQTTELVIEDQQLKFFTHDCFGRVVLKQTRTQPDTQQYRQAMINHLAKTGLPLTEAHQQWLNRLTLAVTLDPDYPWPEFATALVDDPKAWLTHHLSTWLEVFLSPDQGLKQLPIQQGLDSLLDWSQQQHMQQLVPNSWPLLGRERPLHYADNGQVILAAKLQEFFGTLDSPRVCNGRKPITLHLLSPAKRPLQITEDLAHFWQNGYEAVKKEMKGRYPKHPWPDDPMTAQATAKTKNAAAREKK